jgi:hypothetical protein
MSKRVIRLTESELKQYIRKIVLEQSTPSTYRVGQVLQGKRSVDGQMYTIKIIQTGDGFVVAKIKGPGSYHENGQENPIDGTGTYELQSRMPGELSGNDFMGVFTIVK